MGSQFLKGPFPRRHLAVVVARNAVRYVFRGAARGWLRNLSSNAPALGSMTILLVLSGLAGLGWFALSTAANHASSDAAVLHVYLRDDANQADVSALQQRLVADTRVSSVSYVSKNDALKRAARRPGLPDLAAITDPNPFPASLDLKLRRVQDVGPLAGSVQHEPAVDPLLATSYEPGAYKKLQQALTWIGVASVAILLLLGFVAVTVTANSVRAAIHARRDEVMIMQLVGARRWMVRGPFVVEGALTGAAAGLLAGLLTLAVGMTVVRLGAATFAQVAPGLTAGVAAAAGGLVLLTGLFLGSASSLVGIHRHLES